MIEAVLFDFNGTMFFDFEYHVEAWQSVVDEISQGKIIFLDFFEKNYGLHNRQFIKKILEECGIDADDEELVRISKLKEARYREIVKDKKGKLAPGVEKLLDELKAKNIKRTIVSASIVENIEFFYEYFNLSRWFEFESIIYDNGMYIDKIKMYEDAANELNTDIKRCLVFEDSLIGIHNAMIAGCDNCVFVNSTKNQSVIEDKIVQEIDNYDNFDRLILNN